MLNRLNISQFLYYLIYISYIYYAQVIYPTLPLKIVTVNFYNEWKLSRNTYVDQKFHLQFVLQLADCWFRILIACPRIWQSSKENELWLLFILELLLNKYWFPKKARAGNCRCLAVSCSSEWRPIAGHYLREISSHLSHISLEQYYQKHSYARSPLSRTVIL